MAVRAELLRPGFKGAESMRTAAPTDVWTGDALTALTPLTLLSSLPDGAATFLTGAAAALAADVDTGCTGAFTGALVFFSVVLTQYLL